jgi:hypothetical protein
VLPGVRAAAGEREERVVERGAAQLEPCDRDALGVQAAHRLGGDVLASRRDGDLNAVGELALAVDGEGCECRAPRARASRPRRSAVVRGESSARARRSPQAYLIEKLVEALAGLGDLRCRPRARAALLRDSRRLVRTRFVTDRARADLVGALLKVRGKQRCPHAGAGI